MRHAPLDLTKAFTYPSGSQHQIQALEQRINQLERVVTQLQAALAPKAKKTSNGEH